MPEWNFSDQEKSRNLGQEYSGIVSCFGFSFFVYERGFFCLLFVSFVANPGRGLSRQCTGHIFIGFLIMIGTPRDYN